MDPDEHVCLCFRVSQRKLVNFMERERPRVASQLSECLGAGTGCQWCVPFLRRLHAQWTAGAVPDLPVAPAEYAARRAQYRATGERAPIAGLGDEQYHQTPPSGRADGAAPADGPSTT